MTQSRYEARPPRSPRRAKVKGIRPPTPQVACSNLATLTLCIDLSDWWRGSSPPSPPPPHPAPLPLPPATRPGGGRRQPHQALNHHWCKAPQLQVTSNSRVSLQLWFGVGNIPEKMHSAPPPFPTFSGHHLHSPPTTSTTNSPPTQPCFSTRVQRQDHQCQQHIKRPPDKLPGSRNPTEDQTPDTLNSLVGTSCLFSSVSTTLVTKLSTRWPFVICGFTTFYL